MNLIRGKERKLEIKKKNEKEKKKKKTAHHLLCLVCSELGCTEEEKNNNQSDIWQLQQRIISPNSFISVSRGFIFHISFSFVFFYPLPPPPLPFHSPLATSSFFFFILSFDLLDCTCLFPPFGFPSFLLLSKICRLQNVHSVCGAWIARWVKRCTPDEKGRVRIAAGAAGVFFFPPLNSVC